MPKQLSIAQPSTYAGQNFPVALAITTQSFYCKVKKPNCLAFYSYTHFAQEVQLQCSYFTAKLKFQKFSKGILIKQVMYKLYNHAWL